jgi:AcrR family transcriptional regulator
MGTRERREHEKKALRQKILDAAVELFAEDGYRNVTIRKIAEKIEYSLPTIYEHFRNKAEILLHIYYQSGHILFEKLQEIYLLEISPPEKLEAMGRAYIFTGLENKDFYELTFLTNSIRAEQNLLCLIPESTAVKSFDSPAFSAFNLLVRTVEESQTEGFFPGKDPMLLSQTIWAGLHGLVSLIITHPEFPWVEQNRLIESMLKTLIKGSM